MCAVSLATYGTTSHHQNKCHLSYVSQNGIRTLDRKARKGPPNCQSNHAINEIDITSTYQTYYKSTRFPIRYIKRPNINENYHMRSFIYIYFPFTRYIERRSTKQIRCPWIAAVIHLRLLLIHGHPVQFTRCCKLDTAKIA